jgi:hypothetical protein
MFKGSMGCQDRIIGLDDRVGQCGCGVDTELQLGLFSIVSWEAFKDQGTKTRTSASTKGVKDKEALKTGTVVSKAPNFVHDVVDLLLSDGVVTTSI